MEVIKVRNKRIFAFALLAFLLTSFLNPIRVFAKDGVFDDFKIDIDSKGNLTTEITDTDGGWAGIIVRYRKFIVGIAGVAAVTMVLLFIFQFIKLGQSAGNPQARAQALTGVMWTGVAAAGLGAVAIITSLFYGAIKNQ
jgi:hypothetical protein